jgi:hypothetical protein
MGAKPMLAELERGDPPRLFVDEGHVYVPLFLQTSRERDAVLKGLADQIEEVHGILAREAGEGGHGLDADTAREAFSDSEALGAESEDVPIEPPA